MRKIFLLTSILLLSTSWMLAQYSSGSSATDQNPNTGVSSGSSAGSQSTTDQMNQGAQPSSSSQSSSSSNASEPQSGGGYTQRSQSMSSQQGETSSGETSAHTGAMAGARQGTFEGCLSESNGKFHLTDNMGNSYELKGKTANMKSHVGHTIAVTGKASSGAGKPGAMSGEQTGMEQTIQVSSFRHVSGSCKTSTAPSSTAPSGSTGGSKY